MSTRIKWDITELAAFDKSLDRALNKAADEIEQRLKEAEVVPKKSGALEASQNIVVMGNRLTISYSSPYANRLYFHPEYNFSREQNSNAQGRWLEAVFSDTELANIYANGYKEIIK